MRNALLAFGLFAAGVAAAGDLAVSAYWQDHMVLQRGKPITVWGKDATGRGVTVAFAGQEAKAVTGADGFWETTFAQPFALSAVPQTLTITDDAGETKSLADILVGDVFLAAGQSNMDRRFADTTKQYYEPQAVKDFCRDDDGIRFIRIARSAENTSAGEQLFDLPPLKAVDDRIKYFGEGYDWSPATGDSKNYVSSVALNFARYVRDANAAKGQDIPIGIIHASSGGTAIRQWLSAEVLKANGYTPESGDGWYWNNMMAPILRAKFRAVLWYQGCSDAGKQPGEYKALMDLLVKDRRERWGENGDLPFYAVQIATPGYANGEIQTMNLDKYPAPTEVNNGQNYAIIREAQRLWDASDTGTHGLAVIVDHVRCMGSRDLHPEDKNFVGRRLSLFARRDLYGEPELQAEGPVFSRAVREADGAVRITFRPDTAKGLTSGRLKMAGETTLSRFVKMAGPVRGFALCDGSGNWKDAEAVVEGETVVLRAEGMTTPTRFHYGYWCLTRFDNMEFGQRLSLYNGDGLPLSPLVPMDVEDANAGTKTTDPVMLPASCLFSPSTNVTLSCATTGATIRYTLDGSDPIATSADYSGPIAIAATTTVKARAFAANKEPSDIVSATYTLGLPETPVPEPLWSTGPYDPSDWKPLANNILAEKIGVTSGGLGWGTNSKDPANLTDGVVPVTPDNGKVVGFCDNSSIAWTFDVPRTIEQIRLSTRMDGGNGDAATKLKYAGLHIADVYVKKSGSSDWEALGVSMYEKGGAANGAMVAILADDGIGRLADSVVGLKIVFLKGEVVWSNIAEIEATGYATDDGPVAPLPTVASPVFNPTACSFSSSTNVTLSCSTERATIRYTLDGSTPTASSVVYTEPIALSVTTTVKARAFAEGMSPSAIVSATYVKTTSQPDPPPTGDMMFYRGETGYDNWADAMNAAKAGDTIAVGKNAQFAISGSAKSITIDLCGHTLEWGASGWSWDNLAVTDTIGSGELKLVAGNRNVGNLKLDLSTLDKDQLTGSGKFWVNAATEIVFPQGMSFAECAARIANPAKTEKIVVQGVTYAYDGSAWIPDGPLPTYDITIAPPQNGTLETSVTNGVAAGVTVTVKATPADGYRLVTVTMNGEALSGDTFTMPTANVTLAATFEEEATPPPPGPPSELTQMFYLGTTGYDSWLDAVNAAKAGDTITVGVDAVVPNKTWGKTITIDLCGRTLNVEGGWWYSTVTVVDTGTPAESGRLVFSSGALNVGGGTMDLAALVGGQVSGTFWVGGNAATVVKFPHDLTLADCTPKLGNPGDGMKIAVQGVTYIYDGKAKTWNREGPSVPEWIATTDSDAVAKYGAWATRQGVTDPNAALLDAYLLNCANTPEAIEAAKAAFRITGITIGSDNTVQIGLPVEPEGGFNGTVTVLGCETVDGEYHDQTANDRFFKAVLGQ